MKHIHFIGICGVGMGALAIMMKNKGWKVTGSDVGFYPPISLHLKNHDIKYYSGWHPEKIGGFCHSERSEESLKLRNRRDPSLRNAKRPFAQDDNSKPDLVVVGNVASSENPEWKFVQENKIPFVSYPELIERELVRPNSIVCAGTYGKTSTTALLAWILKNADYKPAYMFGGLAQTPELASADLGGKWSVLEGDEYKTARWDNGAKFFHYAPTHLLLTAVKWDHADVYPTEKSYFEAFEKLLKMVPKNGTIVLNEKILEIKNLISNFQFPISTITYGQSPTCDYQYFDVKQTKEGLSFSITLKASTYQLKANLLGTYQAENICGAFAMAHSIGIEPEKIISAIASFGGMKRRLEKRGQTITGATVYDDIAHSPTKVKSVLDTLKDIYTQKLICIFEPNTGNREVQAIPAYDQAFKNADLVIIPRLTKLKTAADSNYLGGEKLTEIISQTHGNVKYIDDDAAVIEFINKNTTANDVVVFCGSHSFRGMIDGVVVKL